MKLFDVSQIPEQVGDWRCLFFIYGETKIRQLELLRAPQIRVVPRAPPLGYSPLWDLVCLDATSFAPITFHSPAYSSFNIYRSKHFYSCCALCSLSQMSELVHLQSPTPCHLQDQLLLTVPVASA